MSKFIVVKGAKEHNLKNISVSIPRDQLVVLTGLSGSGKSSLAFDTIYSEGQRRYVESLSSYARQFLGQMQKPDVEFIEGLSPSISIDQKTTSRNPRSTVGTVTEIYDYLRLLYARIGIPTCHQCGKRISSQSIDQIADQILSYEEGSRIQIISPLVRGRKGEFGKLLKQIAKEGFIRARIDGQSYDLSVDEVKLDKNKKHDISIIVDRLVVKEGLQKRLTDSLETALEHGEGVVMVERGGVETMFSVNLSCPDCGISMEELSPRMFSFNSPFGACPDCSGLGVHLGMDPDLIIPDKSLSLVQGAVKAAGFNHVKGSYFRTFLVALSQKYGFDLDTPVERLPENILRIILYGSGKDSLRIDYKNEKYSFSSEEAFEGIVRTMYRRYMETRSIHMKRYYESFMSANPCSRCGGARLKKESLAVHLGGMNIHELTCMSIREILFFLENLTLSDSEKLISQQALKEVRERLNFLIDVGLDYLTLSRTAQTLSGGEAQRIRLATQIGSGLTGVLYILDEPSIGLHQKDNMKLIGSLKKMRDLGNTLIVVEHDTETIHEADHIIDMGPGAGIHGGEIVAQGSLRDIMECEDSVTGQYLSGKLKVNIPDARRLPNGKHITIFGAEQNNLKNIDVSIPLGVFCCVTGVSGSGKSSLINEILYKELAYRITGKKVKSGRHRTMEGIQYIDKVIDIDQSPIGRTPRSNPATYTGVFDHIREVFALTREAKARGYKKGRFSFNVKGGRCSACAGDGIKKIEMHFLPDVFVPCEVCKGKRYNRETLEVRFKGKNIAEVLDMTVESALEFFGNIPKIRSRLQFLFDVGLGYIKVGQSSTTLSGGEAQRIKLAAELSRRSTGKTLYILDEPTTGLHIADVDKLLQIVKTLVDAGNSVIVIEHNLDVIKCSDYVIDLGPEGGEKGGFVIAMGTPEEVADSPHSYTGAYLKSILAP
ncbi:MAG: excinuclease ABC subunit UvrA [Clostridia bacterium]